jgi:hypothetical protein
VYDRSGQRVWAVDKNERVIRSWLVSGSKYNNELPGTHEVYSRSEVSTAWNGKAFLPHMIRWLKTDIGNIGFHGIPRHVSDGSRYEKDSELGTRLSGGVSARPTSTPTSCGTSPRSAPKSSFSERVLSVEVGHVEWRHVDRASTT